MRRPTKQARAFEKILARVILRHVGPLVERVKDAVADDVSKEIAELAGGARTGAGRKTAREIRAAKRASRPRDLGCIAPGCKNISKGPRFHYLCTKHVDAPKKTYEAWRRQRMQERAEARRAA